MTPPPRRPVTVKAKQEDLDRIDALAEKHRLTRTAFIIQSCLGVLIDPASIQADLDELRSMRKRRCSRGNYSRRAPKASRERP